MAVPVTKLYDLGTTVAPAKLLAAHVERFAGVAVNPATAAKLGLADGSKAAVSLGDFEAQVKVLVDEFVPAGVVLVPRSFGIPLSEPAAVKISVAEKA